MCHIFETSSEMQTDTVVSTSLSLKSLFTPWSCHVVEPPKMLPKARMPKKITCTHGRRSSADAEEERKQISVCLLSSFYSLQNPAICLWASWASLVIRPAFVFQSLPWSWVCIVCCMYMYVGLRLHWTFWNRKKKKYIGIKYAFSQRKSVEH